MDKLSYFVCGGVMLLSIGAQARSYSCHQCPPGTYSGINDKSCIPCPYGTYNDVYAQASCHSCETKDSHAKNCNKATGKITDCKSGYRLNSLGNCAIIASVGGGCAGGCSYTFTINKKATSYGGCSSSGGGCSRSSSGGCSSSSRGSSGGCSSSSRSYSSSSRGSSGGGGGCSSGSRSSSSSSRSSGSRSGGGGGGGGCGR